MASACLAAAVLLAVATTGGAPTYSQYVTTMSFQNGVAPTAGYTGCEAAYITARGTAVNRGGCDTLNIQGASGTYGGVSSALIKFDIGDLPDSAVIVEAKLWVYQINPAGTSITTVEESDAIYCYRMTTRWREGAGTCAGTSNGFVDYDSSGYGAFQGSGTAGGTTQFFRDWVPTSGAVMDSATLGTTFVGTDTLRGQPQTTTTGLDRPSEPEAASLWRFGNTAAKRLGWVTFDVTKVAKFWHAGANNNNGLLLKAGTNASATATLAFASDEYAWVHRRPKLVIKYLDPETLEGSGGGGSARRTVGRSR